MLLTLNIYFLVFSYTSVLRQLGPEAKLSSCLKIVRQLRQSCQPTSGNCFYDMSHASIMIENTADFTIDIS